MKVIEARAIISAKDATGMVFSAIAAKISKLSASAQAASKRAAGAAARADSIERAGVARGGGLGRMAGGAARSAAFAGAGMAGFGGLGAGAAVYAGAQSLKRFGETDLALTRIGVTAEATDKEIGDLNKTVRDTAFQTGQSFDGVTKGLESLVAGGLDLNKALPAIPAIAKTAQAAGAEIKDMADTALSLNQALGISTDKMQSSFDILVAGGKAGKFELKDMAQNMASLLPMASAIGYKGEDGLKKIVALLQAVRAGTGSSSEAADSVTNMFQKIESEETVKKFDKMGVDLKKAMADARKNGKDLMQTFLDTTEKATKGDMSKLPQLITDLQFARGVRAAIQYKDVATDTMKKLNTSAGSANEDFERIMKRPQIALNRLSEAWDRAKTAAGAYLDKIGTSKALDFVGRNLERAIEGDGDKTPEQVARESLDKRRRETLEPQIAGARANIASEEEIARRDGIQYKMPVFGMPGISSRGGGKTEEERLNNPVLQQLRLKLLDLEGKLASTTGTAAQDAIFSPSEIQQWKDQAARDQPDEEFMRIGREGLKNKRVSSTGTMPWQGTHRSTESNAGESNILDMPAVKTELTGTAEVKGETLVKVEVTVNPSSSLLESIASAKGAAAEMRGQLKAGNGPGSTGRSSPDASAPTGASGSW